MKLDEMLAAAYREFGAGNYAEAERRLDTVLQWQPGDPGARTLRARLHLVHGELEEAFAILQGLASQHSGHPAVWFDLALALRGLGRVDEAVAAVERALAIDDSQAPSWTLLGELHLSANRREEAATAFRRALNAAPDDVSAFRGLVLAQCPAPNSTMARRMQRLAASERLPARAAALLHYSLAQVARQGGRADRFLHHLTAANRLQRTLCADGEAEYAAVFDRLQAVFSREAFARSAGAAPVRPTPVFVLGMPRSGTTLVERLLAGHPRVAAAGEVDFVRGPLRRMWQQQAGCSFPEGFHRLSSGDLTRLAEAFARRLAAAGSAAPMVVDKTPGNFHVLGLLRKLFPQAPIIHVQRDPMDTCFSILQQPFDDRSPHTCDQALLGYVYGRYRRLMKHWEDLFGGEYLDVRYERLVASPVDEGRRLFEHCGLEWHDDYLAFHERDDVVRTFSVTQVRRSIYRSSVGAWRPYAAALQPLRDAIDECLQGPGIDDGVAG